MTKVLYALNHKATEDFVTEKLGSDYVIVNAVTYREAVLAVLPGSGADILVFRDSLAGSIDITKLFEQIRVEYPEVRIVFICGERPKGDRMLAAIVSLGIYDIICKNAVPVDNIVERIRHPASFRDVVMYYDFKEDNAETVSQPSEQAEPPSSGKIGGFLSAIDGFMKKLPRESNRERAEVVPARAADAPIKPQVDIELLRETMREEAVREAQRDLDELIKVAAQKETARLEEELAAIKKALSDSRMLMEQKENRIGDLLRQLDDAKVLSDRLQTDYKTLQESAHKGMAAYEAQLQALKSQKDTPMWYSEQSKQWEAERAALNDEIAQSRTKIAALEDEMSCAKLECGRIKQAYKKMEEDLRVAKDAQLMGKEADSLIAKLRRENTSMKGELASVRQELSSTQAKLEVAVEGGPDFSRPAFEIPYLPDDDIYLPSEGPAQTVLVLGAKHGVGNTTVALNLAASAAERGHKTLLIEVNDKFPLLNEYFELTNVPLGLNDALNGVTNGDTQTIDAAIVRFHALRPLDRKLSKRYKRMPKGLHLLLYSNEDLVASMGGTHKPIDAAAIMALFNYLIIKQKYTHVVVDVQPDDHQTIDALINSGLVINRLIMTMSPDPHSVSSAGVLISNLARARASGLVVNAEYIISKFNPTGPLTAAKVAKHLHLPSQQFTTLSEDSIGYMAASIAGIPYIANKGRFSAEYDMLREKVMVR